MAEHQLKSLGELSPRAQKRDLNNKNNKLNNFKIILI